jgi:hypothetical protein
MEGETLDAVRTFFQDIHTRQERVQRVSIPEADPTENPE